MVNEYFVNRFLAGVDPLTQRIAVDELVPGGSVGQLIEWQIVGVFHNVRGAGSRQEYPEIYVPFWQSPWPMASMVVRTEGDQKRAIKSVAAAVNSVDPDFLLAGLSTLAHIVDTHLAIEHLSR